MYQASTLVSPSGSETVTINPAQNSQTFALPSVDGGNVGMLITNNTPGFVLLNFGAPSVPFDFIEGASLFKVAPGQTRLLSGSGIWSTSTFVAALTMMPGAGGVAFTRCSTATQITF